MSDTEEKIVKNKGWNNLIPYEKGDTKGKSEAGKLGGVKSGESKRRRKTMREALEILLEKEVKNNRGEMVQSLEAIMSATVKKAINGDIKATRFIQETIGERPVNKVEVTGANGEPLVGGLQVNLGLVKEMEDRFNETDK